MTRDDILSVSPNDSGDSDEIEILEVVGYDDEPVAPILPADSEDDDGGELPLGFDDEEEVVVTGPPPVAESPPASVPGSAVVADATDADVLLRLRADYDNLRKRIDRERQEFERHANSVLVSRLLPVVDNIERAVAAESTSDDERVLRDGLEMIHRQLTEELGREGLHAIQSVGQLFDPKLHDAVATDPASDYPANTVVEEFQRGYVFQNRVLRHAMVRVSTNGSEDPSARDGEDDLG